MRYFGGKSRIAKRLAAFMAPEIALRGVYVEPFVGGASMMAAVDAPVRIASDANLALITMWRALAAGWKPPTYVSEATRAAFKAAPDPLNPLTAFIGFGVCFGGDWFAGYARDSRGTNYAKQSASSLAKKLKKLQGVSWHCQDYAQLDAPRCSVLYCDPPYAGTTQYRAVSTFDWDRFWNWCRDKHRAGCAVYVSEYNAPDDFEPALTIETKTDIRTKEGKAHRLEKLFVPRGALYAHPGRGLDDLL